MKLKELKESYNNPYRIITWLVNIGWFNSLGSPSLMNDYVEFELYKENTYENKIFYSRLEFLSENIYDIALQVAEYLELK